jgi:hypothetical protein
MGYHGVEQEVFGLNITVNQFGYMQGVYTEEYVVK